MGDMQERYGQKMKESDWNECGAQEYPYEKKDSPSQRMFYVDIS
jgi:hypothetical protein